MEPEKLTMPLVGHWRRQNQGRLRHLREPWQHEHRPTPIVSASSIIPPRYVEYVVMEWREPGAQDVCKVVFNRTRRRTKANHVDVSGRGILETLSTS